MLHYIVKTMIPRRAYKKNSTIWINNISDEYGWTKINKRLSLYRDRKRELMAFFEKSKLDMLLHFIRYGTPNTTYYKYMLEKDFEKIGLEKGALKLAYEKLSFRYACRLMLRYHMYNKAVKMMKTVGNVDSILDYACGVADTSIVFSKHCKNLTIVDLDDKKFEFAKWRLRRRDIKFKSYAATDTESPVELGERKYDLIVMAEFLEHVRDPEMFLKFAHKHIKTGGFLFDPCGADDSHHSGGDHLKEAASVLRSKEYQNLHKSLFRPVGDDLYKKID